MTTYARHAYNKLDSSSKLNAGFADRHGSQVVQTHFKPLLPHPCSDSPAISHAIDLQYKSARARPANAPSRYDDISLGPSLGACSSRQ